MLRRQRLITEVLPPSASSRRREDGELLKSALLVDALAAGLAEVQPPPASTCVHHSPTATAGTGRPLGRRRPLLAGGTIQGRRQLGSVAQRPPLAVLEPLGQPGRRTLCEQIELVDQTQVGLHPQVARLPAQGNEVPGLQVL